MTIALILNIGLVVAAIGVAVAVTVPNIPVLTLSIVLAVVSVIIPIVTWPISHTLWTAIDLRFRPVDQVEATEAADWLARPAAPADNA